MKKKYYFILLFILLAISNCTQKPAEVVYKKDKIYSPNYTEVYVESPDGKMARSLRGNNNVAKAQEISIINKEVANKNIENYYVVKNGDSLWSIAKTYDMRVVELAKINDLREPYNIRPGQNLKISGFSKNNVEVKELDTKTYIVKSGDNLSSIAEKYDMNTNDLADLNNIKKPYSIKIGQKLTVLNKQKVVVKNRDNSSPSSGSFYIVQSGDNLSSIASKYDMSLGELAQLNDIDKPYTLKVGQKIKITKDTNIAKNSNKPTQLAKNENTAKKQVASSSSNKKNSFIWPVKGNIVSNFGNKSNGLYNDGINISASKGTNFKATEDGVVAYVGNELRGYGTIILVKHNDNWISAYAHCDSVKVSRGDKVQKGQTLGTVGQSGNVSAPQLYFSLRSGREAVDPIKYLE